MKNSRSLPQDSAGSDKPRLLIVDDDPEIRNQMKWAFVRDYEIFSAADRATALEVVRHDRPDAVTLDLGLPPWPHDVSEGLATLAEILEAQPLAKVIVITGQGDREHALSAIAAGAYDFLPKPIALEELAVIVRRAVYLRRLESEHQALRERAQSGALEDLIGSSPPMTEVFAAIRKVAAADAPVLVIGETGTGKELAARAIHNLSARHAGPFVAINCGAIPENLLESELFGHEKGSFTGAHVRRRGRIELADRGTLLLDEIGELSLALQVKLLRYLQDQKVQRVGGREDIGVDARLIAATNADLEQEIAAGRFREDLFYRVSVVSIRMAPLRERGSDVVVLAKHFLSQRATTHSKRIAGFTTSAIKAIEHHEWPGNVRELENRVRRAVIMSEGPMVTEADLELKPEGGAATTLSDARSSMERDMVRKSLVRHSGNLSRVAIELGISRPTLYDLMKKLGIERE